MSWQWPVAAFVSALAASLFAADGAGAQQPVSPGRLLQQQMATTYEESCSGCHGTDLAGGRGPSLFNPKLLAARTDADLFQKIKKGVDGAEMPGFDEVLEDQVIWQLIAWMRIRSDVSVAKPVFVADPANVEIASEKQKFRIHVVASGLDTPWGLAFLPDQRLLVTERPGRLRIIDSKGRLQPTPVAGTPKVWERQDGGLLDVAIHPDYRRNGWIYLGYSELQPGYTVPANPPPVPPGAQPPNHPSMTVIVRGKLDRRNRWVAQQEIFRAPSSLYTTSGSHYGTRFGFGADGKLYFTLGERGEIANAQSLATPLGKIHRVNDDGSVPADNPLVGRADAVPTIWSWGHRNPQGLAWDMRSGLLWEAEHGPQGGDEINIVEPAKNYGWGVITSGLQPGMTLREAPGMEQPIAAYTPRISPSGIHFYTGDRYPGWKNSLFVAGLAGQQLRRLEIDGRLITHEEIVFQQFGRTRTVTTGPDGLLYVLLQNPTGAGTPYGLSEASPGLVVRLEPLP